MQLTDNNTGLHATVDRLFHFIRFNGGVSGTALFEDRLGPIDADYFETFRIRRT